VETPSGTPLLCDFELELCAGQRVLVCGPNGSGKSSLLRVLGDVWQPKQGTVEWFVPAADRLVLPQRAYLLPTATIKQNLLYPASAETDPARWSTADEELLAVLHAVGLAHHAPTADALHVAGACDGYSPGERQRISLARLLVRRPAVAILDEPCASVDPGFESEFFEECARRQMTLLTVSHRREVAQHCTHRLRFDGAGGAALSEVTGKGDESSTSDDFVHPDEDLKPPTPAKASKRK